MPPQIISAASPYYPPPNGMAPYDSRIYPHHHHHHHQGPSVVQSNGHYGNGSGIPQPSTGGYHAMRQSMASGMGGGPAPLSLDQLNEENTGNSRLAAYRHAPYSQRYHHAPPSMQYYDHHPPTGYSRGYYPPPHVHPATSASDYPPPPYYNYYGRAPHYI